MSSGFGSDDAIEPATMRGRDWPCLRQFCVFMENRVGRLHELLRHIERHDLKVVGLCVVDSADFAVARLVVDQTDRARELFALSNFTVTEGDVLGVELPDDPQPFVQVLLSLVAAEINIHYTYPLLVRRQGRGAIVVHVDDVDQAARTLQARDHRLLTEGDLLSSDDFY